jgi:L-alanine-DL-glutamate epimerase-like enolase superfamily enzyme
MKITGLRTQPYQIKMKRPIGDANNPVGRDVMTSAALWLDTDEGLSGISMGGAGGGLLQRMADNLLVGKDPRGVLGHWNTMVDYVFKGGNRGAATSAIAALDVALWDLKARINDEPLWKTLGASSNRVRAYASGIDYPLSDEKIQAFYESLAAKGVCSGKIKIGLDLESDMRRIGIMRDALATSGKKPELMVDVNEYWSPKQAIRYIHEIEQEFDLTWVEEPARRWDVRGLKKVSDNIRAAVATGENLDALNDYVPLLEGGAADILNVGAGASGITGATKVADLAYAYEVPVTLMNCAANFMAHLAAVLPNHIMMEVLDNGRDAVFTHTHDIEDGWIVLNDEPGLGFTFDQAKLDAHPVAVRAGLSGWGRRQGAGLYVAGLGEPNRRETV